MLNKISLQAAKFRYRRLQDKIVLVENPVLRENLLFTHSKLGLFLEGAVGTQAWREANPKKEE